MKTLLILALMASSISYAEEPWVQIEEVVIVGAVKDGPNVPPVDLPEDKDIESLPVVGE